MSKISIKIVDTHQPSNSVIVKFASESSAKPIDEYDGMAFQLHNFTSKTPEEFIKEITPYISRLVAVRDITEQPKADINLEGWNGHSSIVDSTIPIAPAVQEQLLPGLTSPEVNV